MRLLDADAVVRKRVSSPVARRAIASVANAALSLILWAPSRLGGDIRVRTFDRFDARFDPFWERARATRIARAPGPALPAVEVRGAARGGVREDPAERGGGPGHRKDGELAGTRCSA
jgi:hypothetical protein